MSLVIEEYSEFSVKNIILTFNICHEDSILNKIDTTKRKFKILIKKHTKDIMKNNDFKLKVVGKNLPLSTDLSKWGHIRVIKGFYPYKFKVKETSIIINTPSDLFNYMVSIIGIIINNKKVTIHRVSVVDKNFKSIFFKFIDINYDLDLPNCFVRIYKNVQEVYQDGVRVLVQKRKKKNKILFICTKM